MQLQASPELCQRNQELEEIMSITIRFNSNLLSVLRRPSVLLAVTTLWVVGIANVGNAAGYASLPVVKPITPCADLAKTDLSKVADTPGVVKSAVLTDTDKGQFCKGVAQVEPLIVLTLELPAERWTQRYVQNGAGGGAPGPNGYTQAGSCM